MTTNTRSVRRLRSALVAAILAMAMSVASCGGGSEDSGKVSGDLTFYTYWLSDEANAMVAAFEKKYPDVHVRVYREGGPTIYQRFLTEQETRRHGADVISLDPPFMKQLADKGHLVDWQPAESKTVPDQLRAPTYVGVKQYVNGVVINTNVFPNKADWPKTWNDFASPKPSWNKKICLGDARSLSHSYTTLFGLDTTLGPDSAKAIYKGLRASGARLYTGAPQASQQISNGECGMLFQIPYQNYARVKKQGAKVAWVTPSPGMIPTASVAGVVKDSKNTTTAKAFVDFMLSDEGQRVFTKLNLTPVRPDGPTDWWLTDAGQGNYNPKMLVSFDETKANEPRERLLKTWRQALGLSD